MADDQQQPQPVPYPFFPITEAGLSRLYQEFGRLMHLSLEQGAKAEQVAAQTEQLQAATRQFTANHTGDGCRPPEPVNGYAEAPLVGDVLMARGG